MKGLYSVQISKSDLFLELRVPVLSTHKVDIVAASPDALNLVINTPFFARSIDPRAIVIVNIAGNATGIAETSSAVDKDNAARISIPLSSEKRIAKEIRKPTRIKESFTTLDTTSSICNLGLAI